MNLFKWCVTFSAPLRIRPDITHKNKDYSSRGFKQFQKKNPVVSIGWPEAGKEVEVECQEAELLEEEHVFQSTCEELWVKRTRKGFQVHQHHPLCWENRWGDEDMWELWSEGCFQGNQNNVYWTNQGEGPITNGKAAHCSTSSTLLVWIDYCWKKYLKTGNKAKRYKDACNHGEHKSHCQAFHYHLHKWNNAQIVYHSTSTTGIVQRH